MREGKNAKRCCSSAMRRRDVAASVTLAEVTYNKTDTQIMHDYAGTIQNDLLMVIVQ